MWFQKMVKHTTSFKLEKETHDLIKSHSNRNHISQAKFLHNAVVSYNLENDLTLEMPTKWAYIFEAVINKVVPICFSWLTAFYFFRQNWLFVFFGILTLLPFIFTVKRTDYNKIRVGI